MSHFSLPGFGFIFQLPLKYLKYSARYLTSETLGGIPANGKMAAWQLHSYGEIGELQFTKNVRVPQISSPNQVLVKVHAASVNPLDIAMVKGYGRTLLNLFRSSGIEFPLTLGRDFSGVVANKGAGVGSKFSIGQPVCGVLLPALQGSHAEYVIVDKNSVISRPATLTYIEAASVLYAGLTAYSGLMFSGGLAIDGMAGKRVLVLGAAGGVGSMAVQLLKTGGATVISSCSSDAKPLVASLGVDIVLDRNSEDFENQLIDTGPYDIILDCAGQGPTHASKYKWKYRKFVTFTSPLMRNFDERGVVGGLIQNVQNIACSGVAAIREGRSTRWAFVMPSSKGIEHLKTLAERNQLKPVISQIFPFERTPEAFKTLMNGHSRGKLVIDVIGSSTKDNSL